MTILSVQFGNIGAVPAANPNNSLPAASQTPQIVYIATNDINATVTAAGYLNTLTQSTTDGYQFNNSQMALVYTTDQGPQFYQISIAAGGLITLVPDVNPGNVLLPVVANHLAVFTNVAGQVGDPAGTAIHGGNIQAGTATVQGSLIAFGAANAGVNDKLTISYVTSAGNRGLTLTNAAMGQATTLTIADPGVAASGFLLKDSAGTQTIATGNLALTLGNITVAAGNITATLGNIAATAGSLTAGTTVAAGTGISTAAGNIAATTGNLIAGSSGHAGTLSSFPGTAANGSFIFAAVNNAGNFNSTISNTNIGQATIYSLPDAANALANILVGATAAPFTANHSLVASGTAGLIGDAGYQMKVVAQAAVAGGAAAQTVMDAFCTAASMVVCTWNDTTNAVDIQKAVAGVGQFIVTSSGDPGASHLNYIITKV